MVGNSELRCDLLITQSPGYHPQHLDLSRAKNSIRRMEFRLIPGRESAKAPKEAHQDAIQPTPPRSLESRRQFLRPSPTAVLPPVFLHVERSPPRTQDRRLK